jgi:hypothetical protein
MPLTGKFSFRRSLTGKVILTVEEEVKGIWPLARKGATRRRWRDASLWDLTNPEVRVLLELRDGAKPLAEVQPARRAAAPRETSRPLLDGMSWRYPPSDGSGISMANGH